MEVRGVPSRRTGVVGNLEVANLNDSPPDDRAYPLHLRPLLFEKGHPRLARLHPAIVVTRRPPNPETLAPPAWCPFARKLGLSRATSSTVTQYSSSLRMSRRCGTLTANSAANVTRNCLSNRPGAQRCASAPASPVVQLRAL